MQFESPFSCKKFEDLAVGDFFLHPLEGGHSAAMKVRLADGQEAVVDFYMEQSNGYRLPSLTSGEAFEGLTVITADGAVVQPAGGIDGITNGAGGASSPDRGSLIQTATTKMLKVKGPSVSTLVFDIESGVQCESPDSAHCIWADHWHVIVGVEEKEEVVFEWGAAP